MTDPLRSTTNERMHLNWDGTSKRRYHTRSEARAAAKRLRRETGRIYKPYKCLFCDGYHFGRDRREWEE